MTDFVYNHNTHNKPEKKNYVQLNIGDLYDFINDAKLVDEIIDYFISHHCNIYNKYNMFVYEQFFCTEYNDMKDWADNENQSVEENIRYKLFISIKNLLEKNGFECYTEHEEKNCTSMVKDYDGVLIDLNW